MLRKLREALEEREEGFTLIELLVVVIIIGILAAIAIPVFLSQRERAWRSASQSDLRNAAVAEETYYTDQGNYTTDTSETGELADRGYNKTADVTLVATTTGTGNAGDPADGQAYCLWAIHANFTEVWYLGSGGDLSTDGATGCPQVTLP